MAPEFAGAVHRFIRQHFRRVLCVPFSFRAAAVAFPVSVPRRPVFPCVNTSPFRRVLSQEQRVVTTAATLETDAFRLMADGQDLRDASAPPCGTAGLVVAARDGDRAAFAELYVRYSRMVHGILMSRVPRADVDDLVQDVFLQAMRQIAALRDASAFGGWLAAIARNRGNDHLRQVRATEPLVDTAAAGGDGTAGLEAQAVLQALRGLPEAYRETLVLRLVEGMTGPEIAAATGLTPASVRVNLHRGMKQLRERLERGSARER